MFLRHFIHFHRFSSRCLSSKPWSSSLSMKLHADVKQFIDSRKYRNALDLFDRQHQISTDPTITLALKASAILRDYKAGTRIHQQLSEQSRKDPWIQSSLIHFYMQCNDVSNAEKLFSSIENKTVFMYGAMFKGYISNERPEKVIESFKNLSIEPDRVMILLFFNACAKQIDVESQKLATNVLKSLPADLFTDVRLMNSAIDMLMKCGEVRQAEELFHSSKKRTIVTYGAMIKGYLDNDLPAKALDVFEAMIEEPNDIILAIVFSACAALCNERAVRLGNKLLHRMIKDKADPILVGSAINMLMKFGQVKQAEDIFAEVKKPSATVYGIMMHGYNHNDRPHSSLMLFDVIKQRGVEPNLRLFLVCINSAALIGLRPLCEKIFDRIPPQFLDDHQLKNALIDMWGKALAVDEAVKVFQSIPQPDSITYSTMINAYGRNGCGAEAVQLYRSMPDRFKDDVSHVCVINACSHAGFVDQAKAIFEKINIKSEQVITTMIDCLSRMFIFDEAQDLINQYEQTHPPSPIMYTALLSSARSARRSDLAQTIYNRMQTLFPKNRSDLLAASILLSNTYRSVGEYDQSTDVRDHRVKNYGEKGESGVTWTVMNGQIMDFRAHDTSHPQSRQIYVKVEEMLAKIKELGYEADRSWVTRPLHNDETYESVLCGHSERLAIAFNLMQEPQPTVIYLTENLRICPDCHHATKLIAKAYQCEIIARDANRGHHFYKNGECSCSDHF